MLFAGEVSPLSSSAPSCLALPAARCALVALAWLILWPMPSLHLPRNALVAANTTVRPSTLEAQMAPSIFHHRPSCPGYLHSQFLCLLHKVSHLARPTSTYPTFSLLLLNFFTTPHSSDEQANLVIAGTSRHYRRRPRTPGRRDDE